MRYKRRYIYICLQFYSSIACFVWKPEHFEFQSYDGAWHKAAIAFVEKYLPISRFATTWRFHTELCKFLRNISTNICGLGEHTNLKLREVSSLFIFNTITISWLYSLNGFRFIFLLRDSENDLYFQVMFSLVSRPSSLLNKFTSQFTQDLNKPHWCFLVRQ